MSRACQHVAVCGAGPAGLAISIHLARAGCEVSLFDRSDLAAVRVGEHVSPRGGQLLRQLGLDPQRAPFARLCPEVRSVWGDGEVRSSHSIFDPDGPGFLVARPDLDRHLAALAEQARVDVALGTQVRCVERQGGSWRLGVRAGSTERALEADFIVDATGRAASIARKLWVGSQTLDRLIGICGYLDAPIADPYAVLIETNPDGWWYSAGLPDGTAIATFMTDADTIAQGIRPADLWRRRLSASPRTRERLGGPLALDRVTVRAAQSRFLERFAGPGWLAVGDSAASYDPLSSTGIEKALAHARAAAAAIGNPAATAAYSRRIGAEIGAYLQARHQHYRAQRQWPEQPFWRRRGDSPPEPDAALGPM